MRYLTAAGRAARAAGVLLVALACPASAQQSYPSKPIRIIVPYAPGAASTHWRDCWGQN